MTSSRVSRLTNLLMIGFGPFVAFRAGHVDVINGDVTAHSFKDANTIFRRVYSRLLRSCLSNIGHTDKFNIKAVTVLDQIINFNSRFVDWGAKKFKSFTKYFYILLGCCVRIFEIYSSLPNSRDFSISGCCLCPPQEDS